MIVLFQVEWSPSNCLDQQPSTEAIRSLFGVSLSTTSSTEELIMQSNQEKYVPVSMTYMLEKCLLATL